MSVSVTSRSSIETAEQIDLDFWHRVFFVFFCVLRKFGYFKQEHFSLELCAKRCTGTSKISSCLSIVKMCYQLSSTKADAQSVISWSVVGQLRIATADR